MTEIPTKEDIENASERIGNYIHRTPILTSESINRMFNTSLFFKCENFQKTGAFKMRGATSAKEVFEDLINLDSIVIPVGGGEPLRETILFGKYFSPSTKVIATEPKGADDTFRSVRDNKIYPSVNPNTIANGLLTSLSEKTFAIIKNGVERIITTTEDGIKDARLLF